MPADNLCCDISTSCSALRASILSFWRITLLGRPSYCKRNLKMSSIGKSDIFWCISRASTKRSNSAIRQVPSALSLQVRIIFCVKACITDSLTSTSISDSSEFLDFMSSMCWATCYRIESAEFAEEREDGSLKSGTYELGGESSSGFIVSYEPPIFSNISINWFAPII